MTPEQIVQLIVGGGVLALVLAVLIRGDFVPRGAHEAEVAAIRAGAAELTAELRTSRDTERARADEWKALAKDAIGDVAELAEALKVRNRVDEELRRKGVIGVTGDS